MLRTAEKLSNSNSWIGSWRVFWFSNNFYPQNRLCSMASNQSVDQVGHGAPYCGLWREPRDVRSEEVCLCKSLLWPHRSFRDNLISLLFCWERQKTLSILSLMFHFCLRISFWHLENSKPVMELGRDYPQEKNMCLRKIGKHKLHKWVLFNNTILNYFRCFHKISPWLSQMWIRVLSCGDNSL